MNKQTGKVLATIVAVGILGTSTSVLAASDIQKAQQARFGECSHQAKAKGLKGADFKSFMHTCASGGAVKTPVATTSSGGGTTSTLGKSTSPNDRMKNCNADAKTKGLKGTDRKDFMKSCLSS